LDDVRSIVSFLLTLQFPLSFFSGGEVGGSKASLFDIYMMHCGDEDGGDMRGNPRGPH
jgi:hypothetical protein